MTPWRRLSWPAAIVAAAALAVAAAVYFIFDPSQAGNLFPRCPFLTLTGLQCPGCGSQRAIHSLLHGNIAQAWHYNAMLVLSLPYFAAYALAVWRSRSGHHRLWNALNSTAAIVVALVLIVGWWVGRNIW